MQKNPYRFTGPLDPVEHKPVCILRTKEIDRVIAGIRQGDFWAVYGPRQIGKTTFLRQMKHTISTQLKFPCIYIDLEVSPGNPEAFFAWIMNNMLEHFGEKPPPETAPGGNDFGHEVNFYDFLKTFRPGKDKKIVLLLDEVIKNSSIRPFLKVWRKVFNERWEQQELKKYVLVITGAVDLIPLTVGATSPFNIARKLYLDNLTGVESGRLIAGQCEEPRVDMGPEAGEKLVAETRGHPQLLQHLCHILIEQTTEEDKKITAAEVEDAVEKLFIENDNLKTLEYQMENDDKLKGLVKGLLNGEKIEYAPYKDYSLTGSGVIVRDGHHCVFRSHLYKRFLARLMDTGIKPPVQAENPGSSEQGIEGDYKITIYFHEEPPVDFSSEQEEIDFLKSFFKSRTLKVQVEKKGIGKKRINLPGNKKLFFSYLAYKNYKAFKKDGFTEWESIPVTYEYRFSAETENNEEQQPEWGVFFDHLKKNGKTFTRNGKTEVADEDIRQWKFSLQKTLKSIGMEDIIDSKKGGGKGYLLKGRVEFSFG